MINEIYEKNIERLEKKYPQYIKKQKDRDDIDFKADIIEARDGSKSMVIYHNQRNTYINSKYRPLEEAKKWVEALNVKDNSIIIVFGFGMGHRIKEICNTMTSNNILIVVEPEQHIFSEAIRHIDVTNIIDNSNVYLYVGQNQMEYKKLLKKLINWRNINNIIFQYIPNYKSLFPKQCKVFIEIIKKMIYIQKCSYNTIYYFSERWQENLFRNIPSMLKSTNVKNLFDKFKHKPAIIVSAGPSLNKNVELLKEVKEKAVIICVGTALKTLLKENIKPDLIISIDGGEPNYCHFKGINYSDIPLVYSPLLYPEILNKHKGQKILFRSEEIYMNKPFNEYINNIGLVKASGTVAFSALDFAIKMGANPIIFIGQDLAFTNGKTHARGTTYEDSTVSKKQEKDLMTVDGINGETVLTSRSLYVFLCLFQDEINSDTSDRLYIDATEGGAKIKGTEIMTFRETIDRYCKKCIGVTDIIKESVKNNKTFSNEELHEFVKEFKDTQKEIELIKLKCKEGEKLSFRLVKIYKAKNISSYQKVNSILNKLNKVDNYLKNKKENFQPLKYIIGPLMTKVVNHEDIDDKKEYVNEREEAIHISKRSKLFYSEICKKIDFALPMLNECIEEIEKIDI